MNVPPQRPLPNAGDPALTEALRPALACLSSDRAAEAVEILTALTNRWPDQPAVLLPLARAYHRAARYLPALRTYDRLIELGAADAAVWGETGDALTDVGEYAQAIGAYENSLAVDSTAAEARHNLGRVQYRLGDLEGAVANLREAAMTGGRLNTWLALATMIPGCPNATHQEILETRQSFAQRLSAESGSSGVAQPTGGRLAANGRLRIGYVSAYFHGTNYMKPVWGLIHHHDRSAFQIHLFSDSPAGSDLTGYEPQSDDKVHATGDLDNGALAERIQSAGIDILVDLNAYSTPERLGLFLRAPAPVTIAWFNMYATSALPGVQYVVGDDIVVRPEEEAFYTEGVLRLPLSYLTFDVRHAAPPVTSPPCLDNGYLTFGSLVAQYKMSRPVLDAWADLLRRVPSARLMLANSALKSRYNQQYVVQQFTDRGIDAERLVLQGPAEHYAYLQYYDQMDVALDAFPYNGGTTTMEAIWQGVPVLTYDGDRWASRTSASLLRRSHLSDFVVRSAKDYVEFAIELAATPETPSRLEEIRSTLRQRLGTSSICNTPGLARSMEQIYRELWNRV